MASYWYFIYRLTINDHFLTTFIKMHLCCVEDPLNLSVINISNKDLTQVNIKSFRQQKSIN
jgi:hypothetical protein